MCGLLTALPHFNYRTDLLSALVPKASDLEPSVHGPACEALVTLFTDDRRGEATLEAAQMVAQAVKDAECQVWSHSCPSHVYPRVPRSTPAQHPGAGAWWRLFGFRSAEA